MGKGNSLEGRKNWRVEGGDLRREGGEERRGRGGEGPSSPQPIFPVFWGASLFHLGPGIRLRAVEVGEAVVPRQLGGGDRFLIEAGTAWIGGERGYGAPDEARGLGLREAGRRGGAVLRFGSSASRQFASVTPKASSMISERIQPGVIRDGSRSVFGELVALREREPVHRSPWRGRSRPRSGSEMAL